MKTPTPEPTPTNMGSGYYQGIEEMYSQRINELMKETAALKKANAEMLDIICMLVEQAEDYHLSPDQIERYQALIQRAEKGACPMVLKCLPDLPTCPACRGEKNCADLSHMEFQKKQAALKKGE